MLGKMSPFSPVVYYNPETGENSQIYKNGFIEIATKNIKYNSDNDPLKLVYASPSFNDSKNSTIIFVLVYEVNQNYSTDYYYLD